MPSQKNQHYVPKFYQRYFSVDVSTMECIYLNSKRG